jgi:hypothetical protein
MPHHLELTLVFSLGYVITSIANVQAHSPPCLAGTTNLPEGCDPNRIKPCAAFGHSPAAITIGQHDNSDCSDNSPRLRDTIEDPSSPENEYYVQFSDKDGNCMGIIMHGGECWGTQPQNSGNYDCMGRCGPGCGTWACSNWGRDCLKHDVCSFYYSASGGAGDDHCGDEYQQALNDWGHCCVWPCKRECSGQSNTCGNLRGTEIDFHDAMGNILEDGVMLG